LKRKYFDGQIFVIFLALLAFVVFALIGCSREEEENILGPSSSVEAVLLVCNPLAPQPGDVATLTLENYGYSSSGLPKVYWTVEAGSLYANEGLTVSWKVPDTTGVFRVSARSVVDGVSDTISRYIAIRNFERLDSGIRVSFGLCFYENELYFIGTDVPTSSQEFHGYYDIYRFVQGGSEKLTENTNPEFFGGESFSFHGPKVLGSFLCNYSDLATRQNKNVAIFTIYPSTNIELVTNDVSSKINRYNQHTHPWGNSDLSMVVWQRNIAGTKADGTKDLTDIGFWNGLDSYTITQCLDSIWVQLSNGEWVKKPRYYRNIKPMITPDSKAIIYFVDTTGTFEPCIVKFSSAGVPDTNTREMMKVDEVHGLFEVNGVVVDEATNFEWNPIDTSGYCAFIDNGGRLCYFDYINQDVQVMDLGARPMEFVWSPDGSECAVVTDKGIKLVPLTGTVEHVYSIEVKSDIIKGLNWSPDGKYLVFRLFRRGKSDKDTFSALVLLSLDDKIWYFISPRVGGISELSVPFQWYRVICRDGINDIYAPMPVNSGDREIEIFRSYN